MHKITSDLTFDIFIDTIEQPIDHFHENLDTIHQRIFSYIPKKIMAIIETEIPEISDMISLQELFDKKNDFSPKLKSIFSKIPIFFILGGESAIDPEIRLKRIKNYDTEEVIFIIAEHRGYGISLSQNPNQSIPSYVTIKQSLQDYRKAIKHYKEIFSGKYILAGYSYSGSLAINYGYLFPEDIDLVLSSSGVINWPFFMDCYDKQVRLNLGKNLYSNFERHISNLNPCSIFDQDWFDREMIIAFISGLSQMDNFSSFIPIIRLISKFSTRRFLKILKWLDKKFANNQAYYYALGNSIKHLSLEDAKSGRYNWHFWRYQQFFETGIFWKSTNSSGIYQRTKNDLIQECQSKFGENPFVFKKKEWDLYNMVNDLEMPFIYICGGADPWKELGLPPNYKIKEGHYFYFENARHCPESRNLKLGREVMSYIISNLNCLRKSPLN